MAQLYDTVGELNNLRNHTSPKPTKQTQIRDSFVNITGGGNGSGESVDQIYSNYLVQNLVPNTTYSLKFKIGRPDGSGGYTDELGEGNYLIPSAVHSLLDNSLISDGSTSPGHFYWSSSNLAERQLLFITAADDGSNITGSNFNDARQTYNYAPGEISEGTQLYNVPPSGAKYSGFITDAKAYNLGPTGVPQGSSGGFSDDSITPSSDQFSFLLKTKRALLASSIYSVRCSHISRSDCSTIALLVSFRALLLSLAFSFEIMINAGTRGGNRRITIREMTSIGLFGLRVKFFQ